MSACLHGYLSKGRNLSLWPVVHAPRLLGTIYFESTVTSFSAAGRKPLSIGCGSLSAASPRRGNGVVSAPNGQTVWITDDGGALHVLDTINTTKEEIYFRPPSVEHRWTESRSSVSLFVNLNGTETEYAVYAVTDVAHDDQNSTSSRIIAVHGSGDLIGTLRWELEVEGVAVQTPQIGTDGRQIYVTHNDASGGQGYFSVIGAEGNRITRQSSLNPFGPITIQSVDGIDELYWGEANGRGHSASGRIFRYDSSLMQTDVGFKIVTSTVVPPVIWKENKRRRMWIGGESSAIHGWVDGRSFFDAPSWSRQISPSLRNGTSPITTKIISSPDGSRLYVASASTSFYCLNSKNANIVWKAESFDSVYTEMAILSPDYSSIYSIRHRDGTVEKRSATIGDLIWSFNCTSIPGRHPTCQDSVEAEFSLSSIGNTFYYVDIWGTVISLQVDDFPTSPPSFLPTVTPSDRPSRSMHPSSFSSKPSAESIVKVSREPTSEPTLPTEPSAEFSISVNQSSVPSSSSEPSPNPRNYVPSTHVSTAPSAFLSEEISISPTVTAATESSSYPPSSPSALENSGDGVDFRAPQRIPASNDVLGSRAESKTASSSAKILRNFPLLYVRLFAVGVVWLVLV